PDGSTLYAADAMRGGTQGWFHAVNLATGAVSGVAYNFTAGAWDVAVGPTGKGLATIQFEGSGGVPLYQLTTATNTLSPRSDAPGFFGSINQNTLIHRSADRSLFLLTGSNGSNGPIFTYNATTDTFSSSISTNMFLDNNLSAVSRDGSLLALEVRG